MAHPYPSYFQVERGVLALINALRSDTVTIAEASYTANVLGPDAEVKNPMFPRQFARQQIINVERMIAQRICLTEGHPRRVDFLLLEAIQHGDELRSSGGGIGAVYSGSGANKLYYENRAIDVVEANRPGEQIDTGAQNLRADRMWGWDGATFFASTDGSLTMELFEYDVSFTTFSQLNQFFDVVVPTEVKLSHEFQPAWEHGAAAILAAKVGTFPREASDFWQKFVGLMEAQGVQVRFDLDFASKESK